MKRLLKIALICLVIAPVSSARTWASQTGSSSQQKDESCIARMPAGKFKGLCLDLKDFRTVRSLSDAERQDLARRLNDPDLMNPDFAVIDNFGYGKKFWKAIIPLSRVREVIYEQIILLPRLLTFHGLTIKNPVKVSHSQLRFILGTEGPAVRLIDESGDSPREIPIPKGPTHDDLIFALWAVRAQGHQETYNPFHGAEGEYGATYALQGFKDGTDWTFEMKLPMYQYRVKLDPAGSRAALEESLRLATARGITYMYDTNTNSCSNAIFDVLKKVFYNQDNRADNPIQRVKKFLQSADPVGQLEHMKMLDLSVKLPDLGAELHGSSLPPTP